MLSGRLHVLSRTAKTTTKRFINSIKKGKVFDYSKRKLVERFC